MKIIPDDNLRSKTISAFVAKNNFMKKAATNSQIKKDKIIFDDNLHSKTISAFMANKF